MRPALRVALFLLAGALAVTVSLGLGVAPAVGVCGRLAGDDPIPPDAQVVVVGTVAQTDGHGQNALIHVDEVWRGGPQPEWMSLVGTDDPNVVWEDSTQFSVGTRYLVVADHDGGVIRPRGCGYTTPYVAALAAYRPASASRPFAVPRPSAWPPGTGWWYGWGLRRSSWWCSASPSGESACLVRGMAWRNERRRGRQGWRRHEAEQAGGIKIAGVCAW